MVQLIDLWVASLLPGDFLDLTFEVVTSGADVARRSAPIEALRFARGYVRPTTRELWWDDPADAHLDGLCLEGIVARPAQSLRTGADARPPPRRPSVADLGRLLPHIARPYPFVAWRSIP